MSFPCSKLPIILRIKSRISLVVYLEALHTLAPADPFMVSIISDGKLVVFHIVIPLNVIQFSLAAFKIIFLIFRFWQFSYDVSKCVFLHIYPAWPSLSSHNLQVNVIH